jgi:hypothetical protein
VCPPKTLQAETYYHDEEDIMIGQIIIGLPYTFDWGFGLFEERRGGGEAQFWELATMGSPTTVNRQMEGLAWLVMTPARSTTGFGP